MKWLLLFIIVLPMLFIKPFIGVILLATWFWKFRGTIAQDVQPGAGKRAITAIAVLVILVAGIFVAREVHVAYLRNHPKTQYETYMEQESIMDKFFGGTTMDKKERDTLQHKFHVEYKEGNR